MNNIGILIWVAFIAAVFGIAWYKGYLVELRNYTLETREEMKKCTWPTWAELKGSTVVVMIAIGMLGIFTYVVDWIFFQLVHLTT